MILTSAKSLRGIILYIICGPYQTMHCKLPRKVREKCCKRSQNIAVSARVTEASCHEAEAETKAGEIQPRVLKHW